MSPTAREFAAALAELPRRHRAWLEAFDIELFAYYGWGVVLNDAQLEHLLDVLQWPPGTIHVWRWANRTGKTTGLDMLYAFVAWYKWRFEHRDFEGRFAYQYKVLHAAPLGELAGKAHLLFGQLIDGAADQQRDPINQRFRTPLLAPFYVATTDVDVNGVDRPVVKLANNAQIDFRSTQGKAARIESDSWWLIGWDEFPRQLPTTDVPILHDQTFLPRSSDFMAPLIYAGTNTHEAEAVYAELEDIAAENPSDWNFTSQARTANFAQSAESIARQLRLSIDKDIASRSVGGAGTGVQHSMFPTFLLDNAFTSALPPKILPPAADDEDGWAALARRGRVFITALDHALSGDESCRMALEVPWPPHTITPDNPILGANIDLLRSSRTLLPDDLVGFASAQSRMYRSKADMIDSTGEGGLAVFRTARAKGLPAVDVQFQARAAKWVTNKEFGLQALQKLLSWGLVDPATLDAAAFIEEWPEPVPGQLWGLIRLPTEGPGWTKLRRQMTVYRRTDEKLRQDAVMTLLMLAWYLWKLIGHAAKPHRQSFNIVAGARRRGNPRSMVRR